jgi:cell division protein FtsL
MRKQGYSVGSGAPIVRIRLMVTGLIVLVTIIACPLVIVWKQAYIASTSMRIEAMTDTVSAMNRTIASLRVVGERLSGNERIEAFARTALKLDYPGSDRIAIVPCDEEQKPLNSAGGMRQLLAAVQERTVSKGEGE